jgi:hypothetical protein
MNIKIGDKVKILDKEMPHFGCTGKVMDAGWGVDCKTRKDTILFKVKIRGFLPADFREEHLVAYK